MPKATPRLPQAVLTPELSATVSDYRIADFAGFAALVGRELTPQETETLTAIARQYALSRSIELSSPSVPEAAKYLKSVKKAAVALRAALTAKGATRKAFILGKLIDQHLKVRTLSRSITGRVDSIRLASLMKDLEKACDKAEEVTISIDGYSPAWMRFVRDLDEWSAKAGLRRSFSKRSVGKRGPLTPAPYLRLTQSLLETLPAELRQHYHSMVTAGALAQAINRARGTLSRQSVAE